MFFNSRLIPCTRGLKFFFKPADFYACRGLGLKGFKPGRGERSFEEGKRDARRPGELGETLSRVHRSAAPLPLPRISVKA